MSARAPSAGEIVSRPADGERLWTVDDVAGYLRVSQSWVYQHAGAGDLPSLKVGGLLRFDPEGVRGYARGRAPAVAKVLPLRRAQEPR